MIKDQSTHLADLGKAGTLLQPVLGYDHGPNRAMTDGMLKDIRPLTPAPPVLVWSDKADLRLTAKGHPGLDLRKNGYVFLQGEDLRVPAALAESLDTLVEAYEDLPQDPYSENGCRYRRHQRFVLIPKPLMVMPTAISNYSQSVLLNSEDGGTVREFEPLPDDLAKNSFLQALIRFDFEQSPFASVRSSNVVYDVGLHLIRMRARKGQPAVSSPNELHKDGEWATWIHLISRKGIQGGESMVADNDKKSLFQTTLVERLDTVAVWDETVYHHVNPVEVVEGEDEGYRDVLLVDFTPMLPATSYEDASAGVLKKFRSRLSEVA